MSFVENEHKILEFWKREKIFAKIKEKNKNGEPWSFLDGPITANNPMGVHHAWGRSLKDLFQRFKAQQGFKQRLQNGFDCQGLWVEVEVEKELGFKSKKDIEDYGIEKFVNKCKERVHKYSKIQTEQSIRLGMLRDWGEWQTDFDERGEWIEKSHSYYTMSNENNYAIWHFLKKCHEKGFLYKGHDVVPWCARCGTAISQHEILTEEYKEITHQAVYVKFPVVGEKNTYFLAWTTTPWTLPSNVALAVNPKLDYAKVKSGQEIFILLKEKADLIGDGKVIETFQGKKLEGLVYQGIFDELMAVKKALGDYKHKVVLWDEVSVEEGTGVVHSAPGCGQEDFQLAKEYDLPVINPTNNESQYLEGFGDLTGKFVGSSEVKEWIFNSLKEKGFLDKIEDYKHRYPTCWRCKAELIFRLVDEWYISMDKLREPLIKSAKAINWIPSFCLERELDWLKNMHDWLISKKRYWGLALPIFECKCGNFEVIGSEKELKEKAVEGWDEFNSPASGHSPHRPWIDNVKIKCSKCGEKVNRIKDVGNPWLDAGIVPFSTISDDNRSDNIPYFHDNRKEWGKWFPVELVCEGFPGQFKNWFYVLLVMSQVLENKAPFRNLLGFSNVVDEKGEEMHKSKGNAIWFDEGVEKISADVMRWMYAKQNPANDMRFGFNVSRETERKILTLTNCLNFFATYAEKPKQEIKSIESKNILDKWIQSRLNNIVKEATKGLEKFDAPTYASLVENFWINDLSLWYVRRSRKRLQNPQDENDKAQAGLTFYYVLLTIAKLIAPTMPFLAEDIYQTLKTDDMPVSVHLTDWPEYNAKIFNEKLEKKMDKAREVVSLALALRAKQGISVRQKLAKVVIGDSALEKDKDILELIKEELNVNEVAFDGKIKEGVVLDTALTEELKQEGYIREIMRHIQDMRKKVKLTPADRVTLYYSGDKELVKVLTANQKEILSTVKADALKENGGQVNDFLSEKEITLDNKKIILAIK